MWSPSTVSSVRWHCGISASNGLPWRCTASLSWRNLDWVPLPTHSNKTHLIHETFCFAIMSTWKMKSLLKVKSQRTQKQVHFFSKHCAPDKVRFKMNTMFPPQGACSDSRQKPLLRVIKSLSLCDFCVSVLSCYQWRQKYHKNTETIHIVNIQIFFNMWLKMQISFSQTPHIHSICCSAYPYLTIWQSVRFVAAKWTD